MTATVSLGPAVREMASPYSADASDLTDGLATVLSMVNDKRQSRILLLSDGEYTGQDPTPQGQVARSQWMNERRLRQLSPQPT